MRLDPGRWLEHFDAARAQALAGDAEGLHQVRVSLRRLRVWLGFKRRQRKLDRELRWLGRALAPLRDLDVFDTVLTAEAKAALRDEAQRASLRALGSPRCDDLSAALGEVKWPKRRRAERTLAGLETTLEAQREAMAEGDGEQLHRLRHSLRRVRYAREWLGLDARALASEQDRLGALCDLLALQRLAATHGVATPDVLQRALRRGFALLDARS